MIYNGIDLQQWVRPGKIATHQAHNGRLVLGNAGRLVEQKGQKYLIAIAKLLKERQVDFILYIAGEGKLEKFLKDECKKNNVEKEVVLLGFVQDMKGFLAGLDIYLSTSIHEGSSNVVIEAMAVGKPVIAFDVSSMPELVENNETGYLIPFAKTQPFAEKIIFLKNNKNVLDKFAANTRKQVERKFDFRKTILQIIDLIEEKK